MCRLKFTLFYTLFFFSVLGSLSGDTGYEEYSRRIVVQDTIDHCMCTVGQIRAGELTQEEGLDELFETLDMLKFITWYWIED